MPASRRDRACRVETGHALSLLKSPGRHRAARAYPSARFRGSAVMVWAGLGRSDILPDAVGNGLEDFDEILLVLLQKGDAESLEFGGERGQRHHADA